MLNDFIRICGWCTNFNAHGYKWNGYKLDIDTGDCCEAIRAVSITKRSADQWLGPRQMAMPLAKMTVARLLNLYDTNFPESRARVPHRRNGDFSN